MGCIPWGRKELDTTQVAEHAHLLAHIHACNASELEGRALGYRD